MSHRSAACWFAAAALLALPATAQSETLTYQGRLSAGGAAINGLADLRLTLFSSSGVRVAGPFDRSATPVVDGLFTVTLTVDRRVFDDDGLDLEIEARYPTGSGAFVTLAPRQRIVKTPFAVRAAIADGVVGLRSDGRATEVLGDRIQIGDERGSVGVGTPPSTRQQLTVATQGGSIARFANDSGQLGADGIEIAIANGFFQPTKENNFVTFRHRDRNGVESTVGRIEGFSLLNGDWIAPPPLPNVGFGVDFTPGTLPSLSFLPGSLPSLTCSGGSWPTINATGQQSPSVTFGRGTLPSATFSRGTLPTASFSAGRLPSINFLTATFDPGALPSLAFNPGSLPSLTLNPGSLPSLAFDPGSFGIYSLSGGSFPNCVLNRGSLPTLQWTPPTLPQIHGFDFVLPTAAELQALVCWAAEQGMLEALPVAVAYSLGDASGTAAQAAFAAQRSCRDGGVVYGSKGADYAEWLPKRDPEARFEIGQVVGVHGGAVSLETDGADQIMVVSTRPVVLGNMPEAGSEDDFVRVAFMGQVDTVVLGDVAPGDYILPSGRNDGTAIAVSPDALDLGQLDQVLGRAWSASTGAERSVINVAVGLETHHTARAVERLLARNHTLQSAVDARVAALDHENATLRGELDDVRGRMAELEAALESLTALAAGFGGDRR